MREILVNSACTARCSSWIADVTSQLVRAFAVPWFAGDADQVDAVARALAVGQVVPEVDAAGRQHLAALRPSSTKQTV